MSRKKRFILLDAKQERLLTIGYKTGKSAPYRERRDAILPTGMYMVTVKADNSIFSETVFKK